MAEDNLGIGIGIGMAFGLNQGSFPPSVAQSLSWNDDNLIVWNDGSDKRNE